MRAFHRWLLLAGSVSTGVTGLVYAWMKYFMTPQTEWAVVNHPLQPWVLKAHILTAPVLVFALGSIFYEHIFRQIRSGISPGRRTGVAATVVLLPMIFTGYLIQSVTAAGWLRAMVWGHLITSGLYLVFYAAHAWLMARRRGRRGTLVPIDRRRPRVLPTREASRPAGVGQAASTSARAHAGSTRSPGARARERRGRGRRGHRGGPLGRPDAVRGIPDGPDRST